MYGTLPHVFLGLTVEEMGFDVAIAVAALQEKKKNQTDGETGKPVETEEEVTAKLLKALQG
jgi:hypothetical protein